MTRKSITIHFLSLVTVAFCRVRPAVDAAEQSAPSAVKFTSEYCSECHSGSDSEGNLDFDQLPTNLESAASRARWVDIHDRVQTLEMPPAPKEVSSAERATFLQELSKKLHKADLAEVVKKGRGPIRRLNRDEYQQNLRDILKLPALDIRDMLPEDRESHHFIRPRKHSTSRESNWSRILMPPKRRCFERWASGVQSLPSKKYRAVGAKLFPSKSTFGNRQAMFFAKDSKGISSQQLDEAPDDPDVELALFRSAHWPYYGYPQGFVARLPGEYRIRFSARAVLQQPGFELKPAKQPLPMTFRARKPSGPDVSGTFERLVESSTFSPNKTSTKPPSDSASGKRSSTACSIAGSPGKKR